MFDLSGLAGAFGSVLGTGLKIGGNAVSAFKQYRYQRRLQEHAYDLTQRGYREQYGNMRAGLENAGYNPLLALNGMSGASYSAGSATGFDSDGSGYANAITNARQQRSQERVNDATVNQLESQVGVNNAEAHYKESLLQSEIIKQSGYELDNAIKDLQRQKEKKELNIWDKKLLAELENIQNDTTLKRAHAYQAQMDALSGRISANASVTNAKASMLSSENKTPSQYIGKRLDKFGNYVERFVKNPKNSTWSRPVYNYLFKK